MGAPVSPQCEGDCHRASHISVPIGGGAGVDCAGRRPAHHGRQIRKGSGKRRGTLNDGYMGDVLKLRVPETPRLEGATYKTKSGPHDGSKTQRERNLSWNLVSAMKGSG